MSSGRLLQSSGPAVDNEQSPTVTTCKLSITISVKYLYVSTV